MLVRAPLPDPRGAIGACGRDEPPARAESQRKDLAGVVIEGRNVPTGSQIPDLGNAGPIRGAEVAPVRTDVDSEYRAVLNRGRKDEPPGADVPDPGGRAGEMGSAVAGGDARAVRAPRNTAKRVLRADRLQNASAPQVPDPQVGDTVGRGEPRSRGVEAKSLDADTADGTREDAESPAARSVPDEGRTVGGTGRQARSVRAERDSPELVPLRPSESSRRPVFSSQTPTVGPAVASRDALGLKDTAVARALIAVTVRDASTAR